MKTFLLIGLLAAGWVLVAGDGARDGRRGNAHYAAGQYEAAAAAYRDGLATRDDAAGALTSRLWHNLGLARFRQQRHAEAEAAFEQARRTAETPAGFARAAYNAGLNAAAADNREAALAHFRHALLADPTHADARYNYELLMRRQRTAPGDAPPPPQIDPSAYAQRIKAQAEALVAQRRYAAAARLLDDGLRQDTTLRAYQGFIRRVQAVARIDADTTSQP